LTHSHTSDLTTVGQLSEKETDTSAPGSPTAQGERELMLDGQSDLLCLPQAEQVRWNKPNRRFWPWWTGNSLLEAVLFDDSSRP